jgi:hypothetical protein
MYPDPRNLLLGGYSGHILREIKQRGREADYSSPSNAEGKYFLYSFVFLFGARKDSFTLRC